MSAFGRIKFNSTVFGASSLVFLFLLAAFVFPAFGQDFDPADPNNQVPLVSTLTPVLPNVLIILDNSGSMSNVSWEEGFDPTVEYPLYRYGKYDKCNTSGCSGYGSSSNYYYGYINKVTNGTEGSYNYTPGTYNNNGAWYCYRNHDSFSTNLNAQSPNYIERNDYNGGRVIYGRRTTENNNWISGEGWRAIRVPYVYDPETGAYTRYTDNYLAYLFETYTTATTGTSSPVDLRSILPAKTRMMVARDTINNLINAQKTNARFALMTFDYSTGGTIFNQSSPFFAGDSVSYLTNYVSGIGATSWTPLGESLYDAYYDVFRNDSNCQYSCQNHFVVLMTDGEPAMDTYYPSSLKSSIDSYCDGDPECQAMKTEFGYTGSGFPWYQPCTNCSDSSNTNTGESLLDGIAYKLNHMSENDGSWFEAGGEKCREVVTYAIGFAIDHPLLSNTARVGDGLYYTANSAEDLEQAIGAALEDIFERTFSVAGLAFSSPNYRAGETKLVSTRFSSADWSGDVLSRDLEISWNESGDVVGSSITGEVRASDHLPAFGSRVIYTADGDSLVPATASLLGLSDDEFAYLIGDNSNEVQNGGAYRQRFSYFGDVVHSRPAVSENTIFVGSNEGFLHAIDLNSMQEMWVFIPPQVNRMVDGVPALSKLADINYKDHHLYYVDLALNVRTFNNNNYLVGGFGGGGKGYFAMDVTNTASPVLLWSRTDSDTGWENIGHSFSEPQLVRLLEDGASVPAVVFGNGYGVDSGGSAISDNLYVVNLASGSIMYQLPTGGVTGGLSTPAVYGPNGWLRAVYAGDLQGNLWRFSKYVEDSASHTAVNGWYITALASFGNAITAQCNIGICNDTPVIIGGTGRYLSPDDKTDTTANTIFAVLDEGDGGPSTAWYSRSISGGERVTSSPEILYGRAYVVSFTPDNEPCAFGGNSTIYSFKFCPTVSDGSSTPSDSDFDSQAVAVDHLITSNLGTTGDEAGNTVVIAETINGDLQFVGGPVAPASLTGWKPIRWQQITGQ